jgi:hypothetical protein
MALALGLSVAVAGCAMTPEEEAAMIEQSLLTDTVSSGNWEAIKQGYPKEFAKLVEEIRVEYGKNGKDLPAAAAKAEPWLIAFHDRIRPDVNRAPADALLAWSTADYELLALLEKEDVEQCAKLVRGESTVIRSTIPKVNAAIAERGEMTIRAAAAGRDKPQEYATPSSAQFIDLENAIRKAGLDERLLNALAAPNGMAGLSPPEQCNVGVSLAKAIEALPDKDAAQLTAHMLKQGPG